MKNAGTIKSEARGEFEFKFFIEKAIPSMVDKDMILEGIASTTNLDHDSERMAESALRSMAAAINERGVPLRVEHQKEEEAIIGDVFEASVDERNQLHVKARLNPEHLVSKVLYDAMKQGTKMGLSVGGFVKQAAREFNEKTGKMVKTFYDVMLKEVSVTPRPSNFDSWLVAKHISESDGEGDRFRGTAVYQEYLKENQNLDYLAAFAKSIPDGAWHKLASQDDTTMETETDKKEKSETTETEKAVSRAEFSSLDKTVKQLASLVSKGFESMTKTMEKALHVEAHDQEQGAQEKPKQIGDEARKTAANGTDTEGEREKSETETDMDKAEGDAHDQDNPGKDKPKEIGDRHEKTKTTKDDKYDLETVERAIKSMEGIQGRMKKNEATEMEEDAKKSETETDMDKAEETEDDMTKGMHPLDKFVAEVAKTMYMFEQSMKKTGTSIPNFEKHMVNSIREDSELQARLLELLKVPGFKKSVSMGVPYVSTKDGRRFQLTLTEANAPVIEKSAKAKGDFKSIWKSEYSPLAEFNEQQGQQ